ATAGSVPGCVLLGDAAGYLDPITGGGITQALLTAELLAAHTPRLLTGDPLAAEELDHARAALLHDYQLLTRAVLALPSRPTLAEPAARLLAASPILSDHLVGVAAGPRRLARPAARRIAA